MNCLNRITDERSSGHVLQGAETGGRTKYVSRSAACICLLNEEGERMFSSENSVILLTLRLTLRFR
jgi:hypothetical protein